jgi:DNA helicase IV
VPRQILDYASRLLPSIAPELRPAASLRQDPGSLTIESVPPDLYGRRLASVCASALDLPGSVAVICADAQAPEAAAALRAAGLDYAVLGAEPASGDARLVVVPVTLAKGLEFDHVVLGEPGRIAAGEAYGLRRLYVALTRAVSRLTILHAELLALGGISCGASLSHASNAHAEMIPHAKFRETTIGNNGDKRWKLRGITRSLSILTSLSRN